ncbi:MULTISPECIES: hypothetical protein [Methylobacter]
MNEELIIDLSLGDNALRQDNKHLLHRRVYEQLSLAIKTQLARTKDHLNESDKDNINHTRSHDAILLDGERGTGKTWVLVNLQGFIEREPEFKTINEDVLFLDPVDPTLLSDHEDFLNIVVGQINKSPCVKRRLETSKSDRSEVYYRHLEDLATSLEGEQSTKDRVGLDRLLSYQGSLDIAQNAHEYFREVLEFTGNRLIVLPIDDVDMSLCHGFNVLEVVRKYLCSPHVLPIVSGDLRLYQELVNNQFHSQLVHRKRNEPDKETQRKKAQELTNEYLRKVFPVQQRITVPTIENYYKKSTGESTKVKIGEQSLGNLYGIYQLLMSALNGRVNGEEKSAIGYIPRTARELMQLLHALKPVLAKLLNNDFPPLKSDATSGAYTKDDITRWWLNLPKPTKETQHVYDLYSILSSFFHYSQQPGLRELCEALKELNHAGDSKELNELTYLNPLRQLELDDAITLEERQNENYSLYIKADIKRFSEQLERLPSGLRNETARLLTSLPAIEPIDSELKFTKDYFNGRIKKHNETRNEKEESVDYFAFLLCLFSYDDYYSSFRTAPLVFFGRFFELITTSLIRDIDGAWLGRLLTKPPYYSIMSVSSTKTFDIDEDEKEGSNAHDDGEEQNLDLAYLDDFANKINVFRKEYGLNNMFFADISLLTALQSKYFNQMNLYKKAGYVGINKKSKRYLQQGDDLLKEIVLRAAYTYWSALGSFEISTLFFGDKLTKIAHENFFAVSTIARASEIDKNRAYTYNIKIFTNNDFKNLNPFTRLLEKHPIYEFISKLPIDDLTEMDKTEVATKRKENVDTPTNYERIRAIFDDRYLRKANFNKNLKCNDESKEYTLARLKSFYSVVKKHAEKSQQNIDQLTTDAKLGEIIKNQNFFNDKKALDRLLHLIWVILLEENESALQNENTFIEQLKSAGVDENIAIFLAKGIE